MRFPIIRGSRATSPDLVLAPAAHTDLKCRFTDAVSDHLGVVHGLQHCERENDAEGDEHGIRRMHAEPEDKQEQCRDRNCHMRDAQGTQATGH